MTLVESKIDFQITEKSLEDNEEVEGALFFNVTLPFIEAFVLKNPGDFCVSKTLDDLVYLSIVAHHKKSKKERQRIVNILIEGTENDVGIPGLIFARAETLGKLIYQLKNDNIAILSGVLGENLSMNRLLGPSSCVMHNIHPSPTLVSNKRKLSVDIDFTIYSGEMKFADGKIKEALFEQISHPDLGISNEHRMLFEKLVSARNIVNKNLPIRLPIGAILDPPTLIYENNKAELGSPLKKFLMNHKNQLDLIQRINLCSSVVRILSELHQTGIFHGASKIGNYYVEFAGLNPKRGKNYELIFNGANGLHIQGKSDNTIHVVDYDSHAPEVAFTRKVTMESGVFNVGRLFEQILKPELIKSYKDLEGEPLPLNEMRQLMARATHPNPTRRPTMQGVVIMVRDILQRAPQSTSSINIVQFDKSTKN